MKILHEKKGVAYKIFDVCELQDMAFVVGESFSCSEPMAVSQGFSRSEMADLVKQFGNQAAQECLTIVAYSQEEQIIGVLLANDWGAASAAEIFPPDQKFNPVFALLDELESEYRQGKRIGINEYLHIEFLAVNREHRGRNIAHNLVAACLKNATSKGYQKAVSVVTNPTSHHIHKKFGFRDCLKIPYESFTYKGQKVFASLADSIILMDRALV